MALFENYEGRMPQLQPVLDKYGFKSFEDVKASHSLPAVDRQSRRLSVRQLCVWWRHLPPSYSTRLREN